MKAEQLFRKTMPFCMAKFALGGAMVLILSVLLGIFCGIGWLFGDMGLIIGFLIWCSCIKFVYLIVMNYVGYLVKAGHIAVLAETAVTGKVPADQVNYGKNKVKERFVTSNVYFAVDKLVAGAVKEIQRGIEKVSNFLDFVPGMDKVASLAKWFVDLSLGYIDECCLGYTFYKEEQGAFQSACDGVVIYAQNIRHLLKNAAMTMLKLVLATLAAVLVVFVPVGLVFRLLKLSGLFAFVVACLIAWVVKFAFLDSYILCQTMAGYMAVATTTEITFDLYGKLSNISAKFRELWEKGKAEDPTGTYGGQPGYEKESYDTSGQETLRIPEAAAQTTAAGKFCGECGAKNETGAAFCGSCGNKL